MKQGIFILALLVIGFTSCKTSSKTSATTDNAESTRMNTKKGERPNVQEIFSKMDANNDNRLSIEEVKGPLKDQFATIDTDGNGFISMEELKNAPRPKRGKRGPRN